MELDKYVKDCVRLYDICRDNNKIEQIAFSIVGRNKDEQEAYRKLLQKLCWNNRLKTITIFNVELKKDQLNKESIRKRKLDKRCNWYKYEVILEIGEV